MTRQLLTPEWITYFEEFNRIIVGFSGGLDSTVLLHTLAVNPLLSSKLLAVHINHGISSKSQSWQDHCSAFCQTLGVAFLSQTVHFDRTANIEEEARVARYEAFSSLLHDRDCLVLGHHMDDQAETVLLQLFRGAGVDGLSAMMEKGFCGLGSMARPLLTCAREQLETYASVHKLTWIEDDSNLDINYSRNYLRHQIMPLLVHKWPSVASNLTRTANHCQQARANLDELAVQDCPELIAVQGILNIKKLKLFSERRIVNILRVWLKKNQIQLPSASTLKRLVHEMVFARQDALPVVSWGTHKIRRYRENLYIDTISSFDLPSSIEWPDFPKSLTVLDNLFVLTARKTDQGLLVPDGAKIIVRFRQGGELFYLHGQTKQLKKLFQEWNIPPWLRGRIPLVYINDQLACVVGYAISDLFFSTNSSQAWELLIKTK